MGLLDNLLGQSFDDPRTAGLLALAQGLQSNPNAMRGLSGGLLGHNQALNEVKKAKAAQEMQALQMQQQQLALQQAQRQAEQMKAQEQFRQSIPSPQMQGAMGALAGGGGPTQANAAQMPVADPNAQMMHGALQAGLIDPVAYINSQRKDTAPMKLGAGEALIDPKTFKPIYTNPKEDSTPSAIKEYNFAKTQGYPGTFQQFQLEQRRAGASNVNVNTAKPFLNTVAEGLGKQIDTSLENARAALPAIQTAQTLKAAVDSGKLVSGPGASFRVAGLQIGQMLGVGGNSGAEVLANTRQAIQAMAQSELNAAAQMKGQGQITESERDIIRRAASGKIDDLTAPEIKLLADSIEKTARYKIQQHKSNFERLKSMPGAEAIVPFYNVDEPAPYSPSSTGGAAKVKRYNPATGRIE